MDATVAADYTKFIVEEHHLIGKMLKLPSFRIPKFNSRTGGHSHGELSSSEWCDLLQAGVESMHNALLQTRVMQHLCSFAWSHIYCRVQKDSQQVCDYAKHTHTQLSFAERRWSGQKLIGNRVSAEHCQTRS